MHTTIKTNIKMKKIENEYVHNILGYTEMYIIAIHFEDNGCIHAYTLLTPHGILPLTGCAAAEIEVLHECYKPVTELKD